MHLTSAWKNGDVRVAGAYIGETVVPLAQAVLPVFVLVCLPRPGVRAAFTPVAPT